MIRDDFKIIAYADGLNILAKDQISKPHWLPVKNHLSQLGTILQIMGLNINSDKSKAILVHGFKPSGHKACDNVSIRFNDDCLRTVVFWAVTSDSQRAKLDPMSGIPLPRKIMVPNSDQPEIETSTISGQNLFAAFRSEHSAVAEFNQEELFLLWPM